jgi:ABC-type branched-subunit amino acid transport system permease subunit
VALLFPLVGDGYTVGNLAYFGVWVFMALGLSLIWGYGGMLSFGQTAFFGLAGYSYGVIAINLGANYGYPVLALFCALVIAAGLYAARALRFDYDRTQTGSSASTLGASLPPLSSTRPPDRRRIDAPG